MIVDVSDKGEESDYGGESDLYWDEDESDSYFDELDDYYQFREYLFEFCCCFCFKHLNINEYREGLMAHTNCETESGYDQDDDHMICPCCIFGCDCSLCKFRQGKFEKLFGSNFENLQLPIEELIELTK